MTREQAASEALTERAPELAKEVGDESVPSMVGRTSLLGEISCAELMQALAVSSRGPEWMTIRYSRSHKDGGSSDGGASSAGGRHPDEARPGLSRAVSAPWDHPQMARIVEIEASGQLRIQIEVAQGHSLAQSASGLSAWDLESAQREHRSAILVFENANPDRALVVGIVRDEAADSCDGGPTRAPIVPSTRSHGVAPTEVPTSSEPSASTGAPDLGKPIDDEMTIDCGHVMVSVRRGRRLIIQATAIEPERVASNNPISVMEIL